MTERAVVTKRCSKCGEVKLLAEFTRDCHSSDGKGYSCKACDKARSAAYYAAHRDGRKAYRIAHRDERKANGVAYRATHRDERRANDASYRASHKDERSASIAVYRASHRDELRAYSRAYFAAHKDEQKASSTRWHIKHPEQQKASSARWNAKHPEWEVAKRHNRRVALGGVRLTSDVIQQVKAEYGGLCPYCNQPIVNGHIDHIVPVSRGGTNERGNLVWACAHCNISKGNKSLIEFMTTRHRRIL